MSETQAPYLVTEVLPAAVIEQLRVLLASKPSGTLVLHVKDGAVLAGEFERKERLTIPKQ